MDQEKFDKLTKSLSSGSSRRRVLGGAIAALFAGATASVTDAAKNAKKDPKKKAKKDGKKKVTVQVAQGASIEVGPDQVIPNCGPATCPQGCCAFTGAVPPAGQSAPGVCVTNGQGGVCVNPGVLGFQPGLSCAAAPVGVVANPAGCCTPAGAPQTSGAGTGRCGTNAVLCVACPQGCCSGVNQATCNTNGQNGFCINQNAQGFQPGVACPTGVIIQPAGVTNCAAPGAGGGIGSGCCDATGNCQSGVTNVSCGANGQLCAACPANQTCLGQTCRPNQGPPPAPPAPPPTPPGQQCAANQTFCAGACVNILSDNAHCGQCGFRCAGKRGRKVCRVGRCVRPRRRRGGKN